MNILVKLWPRKYWILGITAGIMIIGLIIKIPVIKNNEYQINIEFSVVNIPANVKVNFSKYATLFVKNEPVLKTLSEKFNVKNPKVSASYGKNRSIRFTAINADPKLAEEIVKELIEMFNQKMNNIINESVIFNLERTDYLIMLKQQQIDSVKQLLSCLYEQNGITYTPISDFSNFDKNFLSNRNLAEKGVDIFAEEVMLFNDVFELNQRINQRNAILAQLDVTNNHIGIVSALDTENPEKAFYLLKFIIGLFALGVVAGTALFLILDFGIPELKSFRRHFFENVRDSKKAI